ncbi:unnamed protein product [Psylliodes chrysocephalus]|uniref:H15 domain-containing protein n=1 Tax=Psylliodes chrysocephalus TaxID=3402493 RepID=A0A9P0CDG3_9CUCU|nr:unnamed protein product [Psylliodes chrysocephala]
MTTKFPDLRVKTVQNILDQRRQLFIKDRLDPQVIRNIRAEVELELGITPTQKVEPDGRNRYPPQDVEQSAEDQEALDALSEALEKYSGMDPASRPNIPKIRNDTKAKRKKTNNPRTKPSHLPTSEMVNNAIKDLKECGGSSLQAIKKYIAANYKVDAEKVAPFIKKYLNDLVTLDSLVQTKGKGASGSFKLASATSSGSAKPSSNEKKNSASGKTKKTTTVKRSITTTGEKPKAAKKSAKSKKAPTAEKKATKAKKDDKRTVASKIATSIA